MRLEDECLLFVRRVCANLLHCGVAEVRVRPAKRRGVVLCEGREWLVIVYLWQHARHRHYRFVFFPPVRA